jgi:hypothetical protein
MGDMDADWQPVMIAPNYDHYGHVWTDVQDRDKGKIVRVRPIIPHTRVVKLVRDGGCDANNFYEVHPEDTSKLSDEHFMPWQKMIVCEHQILAD